MENHEGETGQTNDEKTEQLDPSLKANEELLNKIKELESTNDRLLSQSKENAEKYRSIRDKSDAKEKEELLKQENYKGLLGKKNEEYSSLEEKFSNLKKVSLKKDLDFTVAKLIDKPLANGASVDDVIDHVLKTGVVEVLDDESGFTGIEEAYAKVKESKAFLFDAKKTSMVNVPPGNTPPRNKKLTSAEQLSGALTNIFKNKG